jgi:glycosyltransferase involved in cell wall biosynthesis|tara:strand:+ start:661 stop:1596 length:936 start_codon:yes stop_codon:yes gene_type:complete
MDSKVSIVIASYNMVHLIHETIASIMAQSYANKEVILYDDCSTDGTSDINWDIYKIHVPVTYVKGEKNLGVGNAFNEGIKRATGDYIVLMCADDLFCNPHVISDIVTIFDDLPSVGHVTRFYHQFVDGYKGPVRAWRSPNPIIQANNPSGLAFRKSALKVPRKFEVYHQCSNRMFIETSYLVSEVIKAGWKTGWLYYDAIAARVHASTSTQCGYWLKRCISSPVEDWVSIGGKEILRDFTSFIQIRNGFNLKFLLREIGLFIKMRPINLLYPQFWFFALVAILTPRSILRGIPLFYRHRIGRFFTCEVKRI